MTANTRIQYIPHKNIDKSKWDACIDTAFNGLIYGYSYYLDNLAKQWDGLVLNDYEAVMPLTWNKKYGICYLYQPFGCASLGVFGKNISAVMLETFLSNIPERFRYWDIYFNSGNFFQLQSFKLYERINYILNLDRPYETIYNGFRDNIKRNIKKAEQSGCTVKKNFAVAEVIALAKEQARNFSSIKTNDFVHFEKLYRHLEKMNAAITYGILSTAGKLLATCVFFFSHNRAYYILVGNHPNGKAVGASHALINAFIKDYSGENMLLDFEGSDIRNLALFYSSFGAKEEKYTAIKYNRLPTLLKWLK